MTRAAKVWPSAGITHAGSWWSPDGLTWHLLTPANRDEVIDGGKVTALLNGEETRRLRAQVDEVLR